LELVAVPGIDFQAVRSLVAIKQVLELLSFDPGGNWDEQVRGLCPLHDSKSSTSRSFSANLRKSTYRCFKCGSAGNQLDLWAAATGKSLYDAALDLCERLQMPAPHIHRW
jgi:DNA primase